MKANRIAKYQYLVSFFCWWAFAVFIHLEKYSNNVNYLHFSQADLLNIAHAFLLLTYEHMKLIFFDRI